MPKRKVRAIILIDYLVEGFDGAARSHNKVKSAIAQLVDGDTEVTNYVTDMRERRGDELPDISKIKVRL
jgi:endonuclease YncB( thermonuclease family)